MCRPLAFNSPRAGVQSLLRDSHGCIYGYRGLHPRIKSCHHDVVLLFVVTFPWVTCTLRTPPTAGVQRPDGAIRGLHPWIESCHHDVVLYVFYCLTVGYVRVAHSTHGWGTAPRWSYSWVAPTINFHGLCARLWRSIHPRLGYGHRYTIHVGCTHN